MSRKRALPYEGTQSFNLGQKERVMTRQPPPLGLKKMFRKLKKKNQTKRQKKRRRTHPSLITRSWWRGACRPAGIRLGAVVVFDVDGARRRLLGRRGGTARRRSRRRVHDHDRRRAGVDSRAAAAPPIQFRGHPTRRRVPSWAPTTWYPRDASDPGGDGDRSRGRQPRQPRHGGVPAPRARHGWGPASEASSSAISFIRHQRCSDAIRCFSRPV